MYRWLGWGVVQGSGCVGGVGVYKRLGGWRECISWPGGVYRCTGWVERDVCRCIGRLDGGVYRCTGRMGAVVCRLYRSVYSLTFMLVDGTAVRPCKMRAG